MRMMQSQPDHRAQHRQVGVEPVPIATFALDTVALAILGNALIPLLLLNETVVPDTSRQGSALLQSLNAAVYALFAARLALDAAARHALRHLFTDDRRFWWPVAALCALALASMAWSSEPQVTLRRAIALIGTAGVGIYLGLRYSPRQFLRLLLVASVAFAVASLAMVALWPGKGVMQVSTVFADEHQGRWRGVFMHKNRLASLMATGVVVAAGLLRGRGWPLLAAAFALLCCMAILLRAESLTALIATLAGLLGVALLRLLEPRARNWRGSLAAVFPVLLLVICASVYQSVQGATAPSSVVDDGSATSAAAGDAGAHADTVIAAAAPAGAQPGARPPSVGFRRDATATGRLDIWRLCRDAIGQQPVLGYGYGAFWRTGGPAEQLWQRFHFRMPHAHNGWLDLALQLGAPLALLMLGWMLWLGVRLLRWARGDGDCHAGDTTAGITLFGLWICFNVLNLAESLLFRHHEILSALVFSLAAFAARAGRAAPAGEATR